MRDETGDDTASVEVSMRAPGWVRRNVWFACVSIALGAIGLWLRLLDLGVRFDRDGFDEGVYWQTLRALASGHALYQPTFYSQPPISMLAILPTYVLFGQTIWAARLGIVIVSLLGFVGAFLLGYALRGRLGAVAGLLLVVSSPIYLVQSQTLQAEAPCMAFALLAVGAAYLWRQKPTGRRGMVLAVLAAVALVLSISSKLLGLAAAVPIGLLALERLWRIVRRPALDRWRASVSLIAGLAAFVVATACVLVPFAGVWPQLWQGMVGFHIAARYLYGDQSLRNALMVARALVSPLALVAIFGTAVAVVRRDLRVVPLLAWLAATIFLLWNQVPLFGHHLVILVAPLAALATMVVPPVGAEHPGVTRRWLAWALVAVLLVALAVAWDARGTIRHVRAEVGRSAGLAQGVVPTVIADLQSFVPPSQLVITDGQFVAGLADRSTPPDLVDTAAVRMRTGSLTAQRLIDDASLPQVQAVLFYSGRLELLGEFKGWVETHYRLARDYGDGRTLWVKN